MCIAFQRRGKWPASVLIPKFASFCRGSVCELRNRRTLATHCSSVALVQKSASRTRGKNDADFRTATLAALHLPQPCAYICPVSTRDLPMLVRLNLLAALAALGLAASANDASAQDRRVPNSLAEVRLSYAPVVQRAAPAVVNVYAAKTVDHPQPAARGPDLPPLLRHAGHAGGPGEQVQRSLGSGVLVDAVRPRGHQQSRHRRRRSGEGLARRQARVRGRDRAQGFALGSRGAAPQGPGRAIRRARIRRFGRAAGRRPGARHRQSRSASARP